MARFHADGLWQRLHRAFGNERFARRREAFQRRLGGFEPLEQRRLLALTDMGAIAGTAFLDLEGDGLTPSDPRLSGVSVELYEETSGNDQFDPLVDTFLGSDLTDINGEYTFEDLSAGTYWVYQATEPPPRHAIAPVQQVVISETDAEGFSGTFIDAFNDTDQYVQITLAGTDTADWDSSLDTGALGGERDLYLEINPHDTISLLIDSTNHHASLSGPGSESYWFARIAWDGLDGDALVTDPTGLGGLDLTNGGASTGLIFNMGGDTPTVAAFHFHTDATHWSTVDIDIPVTGPTGNPTVTTLIDFSNLVQGPGAIGPVDLTNIGAVEMEITGQGGNDINFEWIIMVGPTIKTVEFPSYESMTLGNRVFEDRNNNGQFDSGTESRIANVAVTLWLDANANGSLDGPGIDTQIGTPILTDVDGFYQFTDLLPADYIAQIGASNFDVGGPLENYTSSPGANDPDDDADDDDNGFMQMGQVLSEPITLIIGGEPIDDGDLDSNTNLTLDFGFVPNVDLVVNKWVTGGATQAHAGDSFSYTVTVENQGEHTALNVVLVDTLPAGLTLDTTMPGFDSYDVGTRQITFNLGDLVASANRTFQINVTSDVDTFGLLTNTSVATTTVYESDLANNFSTADITLTQIADLEISKVDTRDPVLPGETLTYNITVTNNGPSTATDVTVVDTLPDGVTFVSASPVETTFDRKSRQITVGLPDIANGDSGTITLVVTVDSDADGTIANRATVTTTQVDPDPTNDTTTEETTIPYVDLVVNKEVTGGTTQVNAGDSFSYTVTVENQGNYTAANVVLVDTLPVGLTLDATIPIYDNYNVGTREMTFNLGDLAASANRTFQIDVTADADTFGLLTNAAVATTTTYESDLTNNFSTADITSKLIADLEINKVDLTDPVLPGETLTYNITVTNNGPSTATDVTVVDTLPVGVTFVSASPAETSYVSGTRQVTFGLPDIANGDSATISLVVTVDSDAAGTFTNSATVTTTQDDPDPTNDTSTEETTVDPIYGLMLTKDVSHATATAGTTLTYTLDIENLGTADVTGLTVVDTLPVGTTYLSAAGANITDLTGQVVTLDLGTLAAEGTRQVSIRATINSSATGRLTNSATVDLNETENGGNTADDNTDTADTIVQVEVDLAIDKRASTADVLPGEMLTYTLIVTNSGPSDATAVTVVDALPGEVAFVSATGAAETYDPIDHEVQFDIGLLKAGASTSLTIDVLVDSGLDPSIIPNLINRATVLTLETDTDTTNNTDEEIVFPQEQKSSITGKVFLDYNNDGHFNGSDSPLGDVLITLTGTDIWGNDIHQSVRTNLDGTYLYDELDPGTYAIHETQPPNLSDGKDMAGTCGGNVIDDAITQIDLEGDIHAIDYTFAECRLSKRDFLAST